MNNQLPFESNEVAGPYMSSANDWKAAGILKQWASSIPARVEEEGPNRIARSPIVAPDLAALDSLAKSSIKRKKRQTWSRAEDDLLEDLVKNGIRDKPSWSYIADELNLTLGTCRAGKQCRERWRNHLRPNIKKGDWTASEEYAIRNLYEAFGPKWTWMAKIIKNRTDNDIKNKWYSMERSHKAMETKLEAQKEKWSTSVPEIQEIDKFCNDTLTNFQKSLTKPSSDELKEPSSTTEMRQIVASKDPHMLEANQFQKFVPSFNWENLTF